MKKLSLSLAFLLLSATGLFALTPCGPYSDFAALTASTNLAAAMDGKLNIQCGDGPPTSNAGTAGIDAYIDRSGRKLYIATVSGSPAAWSLIGSASFEDTANKGASSGYAPLDGSSHVPLGNLPTIPSGQISGLPAFPSGTIVGATDTQTLSGKTLTSPSLGAGSSPVTETWTVGAGGVTANTLVQMDTSAPAKIIASTTGAYGVAMATVAASGTVEVARIGTVNCVTDTGGATAGDLVILGTGSPVNCKDAGTASSSAIAITSRIIGVFRATATAGNPALVELTPAHFGTKLTGAQVVIPCAGSDDTAAIQTALTAGGTVVLSGAICAISSTLTIPSTTSLLLNGVTLARKAGTLTAAGDECFLTNSNWMGGNSDISILGPGILNCNGSTQTLTTSGSGLGELFPGVGIRLNNVVRTLVADMTIYAATFSVQEGNVTNSIISDLNLNNNFSRPNQDGVHINGPASYILISNINHVGTDNSIALNADDEGGGEMTAGNISNVVVTGGTFNLGGAVQCVRLLANTHTIQEVELSHLSGACGGNVAGITLGWFNGGETTGGTYQDIQVSDIQLSTGGPLIALRPGSASYGFSAKQLHTTTCCGNPALLLVGGTFGDIQLDDALAFPFFNYAPDLVAVTSGTVDSMRLSGLYATTANSLNPIAHLVNATGGTISNLFVNGSFVSGASGSGPTTGGTITNTFYDGLSWNGVSYPNGMTTFANAPPAPMPGWHWTFTDSNTAVWGAVVAGGGSNRVLAQWNGTNWTVVGK